MACTLVGAEYNDRLGWIKRLNEEALCDYRRDGSRIELSYHWSAAAQVREFVRREQQCCPFLDFTICEQNKAIIVIVTAPEGVGANDQELFGPYTAAGDRQSD
ncbi:hypothetical protein H7K24_04040 [Mycobacterium fragae]|nr:hypothetical protein [Mycobacterium fragae]